MTVSKKKTIPGVNGEFLPSFLQVAVGMKAILSGHTGSTNVSTNRISFATSFGGSVSPTRDQSTRHVLVLCGVFFKKKQTNKEVRGKLFI